MNRSFPAALMILVLLLAGAGGCAPIPPAPTAQQTETWKTYSSPEYGFSIRYPAALEIVPGENNASVNIGEQIQVRVSAADPLECRGDCPFVESSEAVTVAGLAATKVSGYIGSIGGNVPQRFLTYIFQQDGRYYIFTLYALGLKATGDDPSTIWPLSDSDVALFDRILATLRFTN